MHSEAISRLTVRLQQLMPEAEIQLNQEDVISVNSQKFPNWCVLIQLQTDPNEKFQMVTSSISLENEPAIPNLESLTDADFNLFIAGENLGLRGATLLAPAVSSSVNRSLYVRSSFLVNKGRSVDESECLLISILTIVRFARTLIERMLHNSLHHKFSLEMYRCQFLSQGPSRPRYIPLGRQFIDDNTQTIFQNVVRYFRHDLRYNVTLPDYNIAKIRPRQSDDERYKFDSTLSITTESPLITIQTPIGFSDHSPTETLRLVSKLNQNCRLGHFEVTPDGSFVTFISWKYLTHDFKVETLKSLVEVSHHNANEMVKLLSNKTFQISPN